MNVPGFHIGLPQTTFEWLVTLGAVVFGVVALVIIGLFVRYAGKTTIHFIKECLSDPTGHGEIKSVLACAIFALIIMPMIWFGLALNRWAPEYVWVMIISVFLGLLGLGSFDFSNAMKSGVALIKSGTPPKDKIVQTDPKPDTSSIQVEEEPFVLKR